MRIMGISSHPFLVSFKGAVEEEMQARRRRQIRKQRIITRNTRRPLMKGRTKGVHRRVRTLKKLIPNTESMGIEGLFRETADYILTLQMRVKVMQIMVKVLTANNSSSSDEDDE